MAGQVVYAAVASKRRETFTCQASDPGDVATYTEVTLRDQSDDADSTAGAGHRGTCLQIPRWCYLVLTLYCTALILLLTAIFLALKCPRL